MPPEVLYGTDIPTLLARARTRLGDDARMIALRRAPVGGYELVAIEWPTVAPPLVDVSALGDATSLRGGTLWITPLVTDPGQPPIATARTCCW